MFAFLSFICWVDARRPVQFRRIFAYIYVAAVAVFSFFSAHSDDKPGENGLAEADKWKSCSFHQDCDKGCADILCEQNSCFLFSSAVLSNREKMQLLVYPFGFWSTSVPAQRICVYL